MNRSKFAIMLVFTLLVAISSNCDNHNSVRKARKNYSYIVGKTFRVYSELHPLRSTRLGITSSDSLLFTFSEREINSSINTLEALLKELKNTPLGDMDETQLDNLKIINNWIQSEIFTFTTLQNYRRSPLIYCWIIQEALTSIPQRSIPPYGDELSAYKKRTSIISLLLKNARTNLQESPRIHLRIAREWIQSILAWKDVLDHSLETRYNTGADFLEKTFVDIADFGDYIEGELMDDSHGRVILGFEILSDILLFSEHLKLDPTKIIPETENKIRTLSTQLSTLTEMSQSENGDYKGGIRHNNIEGRKRDKLSGDNCRSYLLECINRIDSALSFSNELQSSLSDSEIVCSDLPLSQTNIIKNPYLTVPIPEETNVVLSLIPFLSTNPAILVSGKICQWDRIDLEYEMMEVSSLSRDMARRKVEKNDTTRILLPSNLYSRGWRLHSKEEVIKHTERNKLALKILSLKQRILYLCRTVAVLRFHSGTYTLEDVTDFLVKRAAVSRETAERESDIIAAFPMAAFPGIAIVVDDRIASSISSIRNYSSQKIDPYDEIMSKYYTMPLSLIYQKIKD
jgi:hypothetical protein